MSSVIVLTAAIALVLVVLFWSSRYGAKGTTNGTSLRRRSHAHTTSRGRPKVGYANRPEAEVRARQLMRRDGQSMDVYQCPECTKWHVGHAR